MKRRLLKKIVKKYGDSWWESVDDTPTSCSYFLKPPARWRTKKIMDEFGRQHISECNEFGIKMWAYNICINKKYKKKRTWMYLDEVDWSKEVEEVDWSKMELSDTQK